MRSVDNLLEFLKRARGKHVTCPYCGAGTLIMHSVGSCSGCENVLRSGPQGMAVTWNLGDMEARATSGDFDGAVAIYAGLEPLNIPEIFYTEALALIAYSNHTTSLIGYRRKGFMEENIGHRDRAAALYSLARLKLDKAIALANAEIRQETRVADMHYLSLLANLKLGRMAAAGHTLDIIRTQGDGYLAAYSEMVFFAQGKDLPRAQETALALLGKDRFSINAFHYLALSLRRMGKSREARRIMEGVRREHPADSILGLGAVPEEELS